MDKLNQGDDMEENQEIKEVEAPVVQEQVQEVVKTEDIPSKDEELILGNSALNQLFVRLQETFGQCVFLVQEYNKRTDQLADREKKVFSRETIITVRETNIKEREAVVLGVENAIKLHKDAESLMEEAQTRLNATREAESKLRTITDEQRQILQEDRIQTQKEANNLEAQKKSLDVEVQKRVKQCLINMGLTPPAVIPAVEEEKK